MSCPTSDLDIIPTNAVTVAGSRFKPGPHQYVILPPYGDGTTRYDSREQAMAAARAPKEHR